MLVYEVIVVLVGSPVDKAERHTMHLVLEFPGFEENLSSFHIIDSVLPLDVAFHIGYFAGFLGAEKAPMIELYIKNCIENEIEYNLTTLYPVQSESKECLEHYIFKKL